MLDDLTGLTIFGFFLSCASLYGPGVFPDAIYISNLDDLEARIRPLWRRLVVGSILFSASVLGVIFIEPAFAFAQDLSRNAANMGLIDAIIFLGVLVTWVISFPVTILCFVLELFRKRHSEKSRLEGIAGRGA